MSDASKKEPTSAEAMLFFSIVRNTRNTADVDWQAVAAERGFKNAEVAKVRFGQVKRKLGIFSDGGSSARTTPKKPTAARVAKTPRSAKGKGRGKPKKEESEEDPEEELEEEPEPKKEEIDDDEMRMHLHREVKQEEDADVSNQLREEMFAYGAEMHSFGL